LRIVVYRDVQNQLRLAGDRSFRIREHRDRDSTEIVSRRIINVIIHWWFEGGWSSNRTPIGSVERESNDFPIIRSSKNPTIIGAS
jgi:hypothetical protein